MNYHSGNDLTQSDLPWITISLCVIGAFILYNGIRLISRPSKRRF